MPSPKPSTSSAARRNSRPSLQQIYPETAEFERPRYWLSQHEFHEWCAHTMQTASHCQQAIGLTEFNIVKKAKAPLRSSVIRSKR